MKTFFTLFAASAVFLCSFLSEGFAQISSPESVPVLIRQANGEVLSQNAAAQPVFVLNVQGLQADAEAEHFKRKFDGIGKIAVIYISPAHADGSRTYSFVLDRSSGINDIPAILKQAGISRISFDGEAMPTDQVKLRK